MAGQLLDVKFGAIIATEKLRRVEFLLSYAEHGTSQL
jgi:hypothetical protein